ncbi:MAG: efflux RND transporter periplasmic adaptor subunit [Deltaproteobacteria bacterium]|nr:efflux RND transporter periplasmic adaptor subunit [Deltaproteobacteria bacterium]MBW2420278.1 efflux RND transporter periplasmic adaptor subunit [Deltaproteobacteria bacterium]
MHRLALTLRSGMVALVGSFVLSCGPDEAQHTPVFATSELQRGTLVATVSATGSLSPLVAVQVGSEVSGTIQRLHADFNSRVKSGELIAELGPSLFQAKVAQAEADLESALASQEKAHVQRRDAQRQLDRLLGLSKRHVVSDSDLDAAQFALEAARAEERVRAAAVGQRRGALTLTQVDLRNTRILAPIDGVVISRNVDVGQTVAASLQAPILFVIAGDLERMQIEAEVDEAFIAGVAPGQSVAFEVFAYPERRFQGRVAQVRLDPIVEAGVVKYNCIIHVDNADLALKPGMTANVAIEVERREKVLRVPNAALRFVPEPLPEEVGPLRKGLDRREAILWIVGGEGLRPIVVKTDLASDEQTEVSADELKEGMVVALPSTGQERGPRRRRGFRFF